MEEILINEAHNYFLSPYPNKIEESVLGELSLWIENHFDVKVKKSHFSKVVITRGSLLKDLKCLFIMRKIS